MNDVNNAEPIYEVDPHVTQFFPKDLSFGRNSRIAFNLGFYYDRMSKNFGCKILIEKDSGNWFSTKKPHEKDYYVYLAQLKYIDILPPGMMFEYRIKQVIDYGNGMTSKRGKTKAVSYGQKFEIPLDTGEIKYGTFKNLGLLNLLHNEMPQEYLNQIADEYCGVTKVDNTPYTFIFPSMTIAAATYFHNKILAEAAVYGDFMWFDRKWHQYYGERGMPKWMEYAVKKHNYQRPDIFYRKNKFANKEFLAIYKRIREQSLKSGSRDIHLLVRFPFEPGEKHRLVLYGIPLEDNYFLVHQISEYDIDEKTKVRTGVFSVEHRLEHMVDYWEKESQRIKERKEAEKRKRAEERARKRAKK